MYTASQEVTLRAARLDDREMRRLQAVRRAVMETGRRPTLLYRKFEGVVVCVTPEGFEEARTRTFRLHWSHKDVLYPPRKCFVFVTPEGARAVSHRAGKLVAQLKIAGTEEELKKFVKLYGLELSWHKNLFVPWISTEDLSIADQYAAIENCAKSDLFKELVVSQFPAERKAELLIL